MKKIGVLLLSLMLVLGLVGCSMDVPPPQKSSYEQASKINEENASKIIANDTMPKITKSLERENIKRRLEFINQPDRVGYLYLLSDNGQLIREVQVLGKVSSLNSYLTPMEDIQIIKHDGGEYNAETPVVTSAAD
jgi:hypothetical protein